MNRIVISECLKLYRASRSISNRECAKEIKCADGYVIRGAVQGIIHSMQGPYGDTPGPHLGGGKVIHDCTNFEAKTKA